MSSILSRGSEYRDIRRATMGCISRFEACLSAKALMEKGWAENRLADMNIWATRLGALAKPEVSLGRSQFQTGPRFTLTNLLLTLQVFIDACRQRALDEVSGRAFDDESQPEDMPISPTESDFKSTHGDESELAPSSASWFINLGSDLEIPATSDTSTHSTAGDEPDGQPPETVLAKTMHDIDHLVDQLFMLGNAIRDTGTAAALLNADASFKHNQNKELQTYLEFILLNNVAKKQVNWEDNQTVTANNRMDEINKQMQEERGLAPEQRHLIQANLRRRHRFDYARRHQHKLDQTMMEPIVATHKPVVVRVSEDNQAMTLDDHGAHTLENQKTSAIRDSPSRMLPAGVPKITSHYPLPPVHGKTDGFKCPCCYETLPEMFRDRSRWTKHLTEDLCPYTCPFPGCPRPETLYISRASWRNHVLRSHVVGHYWKCFLCTETGTPNTFTSVREFDIHNHTKHKDALSNDQIDDLRDSCRNIVPQNIAQCPLCPWPRGEEPAPDASATLEHVGNCIHEFSLNAFPWANASEVDYSNTSYPVSQAVKLWLQGALDTTEETDIQKIQEVDIRTFNLITVPPEYRKVEPEYVAEEYFAESSAESSQTEQGSLSFDDDLPQVRGTYSDDAELDVNENEMIEQDVAILDWLMSNDYRLEQTDYLKRRKPGTGQWFLDSEEYQSWLMEPSQTLFCPGILGAGKTVMTSIVVDDLEKTFRSKGIAYIYCNYRHQTEQSLESLLSSLLRQLAQRQPSLPLSLKELYDGHKENHTRPSLDEILKTLEIVIAQNSRVFIVVDALDGCQSYDGCRTRFLSTIFDLQRKTGMNLFATSRNFPEITTQFENSLSKEIRASDDDIHRYLQGRMLELPKFVANQLQDEIMTSITEAVDGMFLLAKCHFDSLIGKDTPAEIHEALRNMVTGPGTYDDAYRSVMEQIERQLPWQVSHAKKILSWITCAQRPLKKLELKYALGVVVDEVEFDEENLPSGDLISLCAGLVIVDEKSSLVRFIHVTVHDFFKRTQHEWFPGAQVTILTTCLTYLSYRKFGGYADTDKELENRLRFHPFYGYAACNWGHHARNASASAYHNIIAFLEKQDHVEASSQALMVGRPSLYYSQIIPKQMTGLHLAAYFGLDEVLANMQGHYNVDVRDSYGQTPLAWAAKGGHETVVKLLLVTGSVNPDSKDKTGRTPLSWATVDGHEAVVKLLLDTGRVDPDSKDRTRRTPLSWASGGGHGAVVKLLLDTRRVDPDSKDILCGQSPLSWATEYGHGTVVKLLLATGRVDPDSTNKDGRTPLSWAARNGHEAIVKLLLDTGRVDPDSKDTLFSQSPLSWAAEYGHEPIVKLLLATGRADPNSKDKNDRTPLSWAARDGHEAIVKLLLDTGRVNPDLKDKYNRTPLLWAVERGFEAVVKLLLVAGADPNAKVQDRWSPLVSAAERGHEALAKLLLDTGRVDPDSKDNFTRKTALSKAAKNGHEAIVKLLIVNGVHPDSKDSDGRTPLSLAASEGREGVIKLLIANGAEPDSKDSDRRTPLSFAAEGGCEAVVRLLLGTGRVDLASKDRYGQTPLSLAKRSGLDAIVKLLERGVDP